VYASVRGASLWQRSATRHTRGYVSPEVATQEQHAAPVVWLSWRTMTRWQSTARTTSSGMTSRKQQCTRSLSHPPPPRIAAARVRLAAPAASPWTGTTPSTPRCVRGRGRRAPWSSSCGRCSSMNFLGEIKIDVGVDEESSIQEIVDGWRVCTRGLR
jgi:hypothetical protein